MPSKLIEKPAAVAAVEKVDLTFPIPAELHERLARVQAKCKTEGLNFKQEEMHKGLAKWLHKAVLQAEVHLGLAQAPEKKERAAKKGGKRGRKPAAPAASAAE